MTQTASIAAMIGDLYTASVRCVAVILMFACCAEAQWVTVRTEGVPRTKDGKLNRTAPAPHTPDGKLDFSGLWYPGGERQPCGAKPEDCIEQGLGKSLEGGSDLLLRGLNCPGDGTRTWP